MMMASAQATNSTDENNNNGNNNNSTSASQSSRSPVQEYLTKCTSLYSCIYCRTHLANHDELVSRVFQGNHGRAYLFNKVVNVNCGPTVQRTLVTGAHAVADIYCNNCHTTLGWKYEKAYEDRQKYKEGKYIIELAHVVRESRHLEFDKGEMLLKRNRTGFSQSYRSSSKQSQYTTGNNNPRCSHSSAASSNSNNNPLLRSSPTSPSVANGGEWSSSSAAGASGTPMNEEVTGSGVGGYNDDDDDDYYDDYEELMFPFYDDMCSSRSSYPSHLSSSLHNRMRRSLYLESTPYDWKYATSNTTTSSFSADNSNAEPSHYRSEFEQAGQTPRLTSATNTTVATEANCCSGSSLADSGLSELSSPSASSSSSDASPEQKLKSYHNDDNSANTNSSSYKYIANGKNRDTSEHSEHETDNDDMQFKFEADKPESVDVYDKSTREQTKHCDQLNSDTKTLGSGPEQHKLSSEAKAAAAAAASVVDASSSNSNNKNSSEIEQDHSPASVVSRLDINSDCGNPIRLEDEEFYDCYTDHEVTNILVESNSRH